MNPLLDTNTVAMLQQLLSLHPEALPVYQRHAPAFGIALVWLVREWHNLGGLPALQAYFDGREGGAVVWIFQALFGRAKPAAMISPAVSPEMNQEPKKA